MYTDLSWTFLINCALTDAVGISFLIPKNSIHIKEGSPGVLLLSCRRILEEPFLPPG